MQLMFDTAQAPQMGILAHEHVYFTADLGQLACQTGAHEPRAARDKKTLDQQIHVLA